ncbi:hypothetical protein C8T65DRAFT_525862, partial [Cerioporus squamosus]
LRKSKLQGVTVPGDVERIVTALFADDTMAYLSEQDSFHDLQSVLDRWCLGARARFNVEKTDVIPIGTKTFRDALVGRTSPSSLGVTIPLGVRIVPDGELIRSLGAWIGNTKNEDEPWMRMISTIKQNLQYWTRRKPTLYGRKLIVGMEVGSRSQFLAKAQPMSDEVEDRLTKVTAEFMAAGERHPRIGRETLYLPLAKGGLNLLDVSARNEAIDLTYLKQYVSSGAARPRWTIVADAIFARKTAASAKAVEDSAKVNTLIQSWKASTHPVVGLSRDLKRMLQTANRYNAALAPVNPAEGFKGSMPVWYH